MSLFVLMDIVHVWVMSNFRFLRQIQIPELTRNPPDNVVVDRGWKTVNTAVTV
jgi:hypothetical protein